MLKDLRAFLRDAPRVSERVDVLTDDVSARLDSIDEAVDEAMDQVRSTAAMTQAAMLFVGTAALLATGYFAVKLARELWNE